jgi:hypothetical protein
MSCWRVAASDICFSVTSHAAFWANRMQFHLLPPTICLQLDLTEAAFGSKSFDSYQLA